jgi:hypothetical protein
MATELPEDVVEEAERLTRFARSAVDDNEAVAHRERRDELLAEHGYTARTRSEDTRTVLVLHPAEWVEDGVVDVSRLEDTSRAVERQLAGTGDEDEWERVEEHNRELAEEIAAEHGEAHGTNAHAFADFMGNHYARRMETATPDEVAEFLEDYYPRNAWPTDEQAAVVEETVELVVGRE